MNPPPGIASEDLTEQHCIDNPLDLEELTTFTDGAVPNPEVCCGEATTDPEVIGEACVVDCAYAACKLAVLKLEEAAQGDIPSLTSADLITFANFLELPANQDSCAKLVAEAAPNVVSWNLGEATSEDEFGHIEQMTLKLQCNVTTAEQQIYECTSSANTPEQQFAPDLSGTVFGGAVTFSGLYGNGSTDVESSVHTMSAPVCSAPPCSFELRQFDIDLASFSAGDFEFVDPRLELATIASGWRSGTDIEMPIGALRFAVFTKVKVDGAYLLGTDEFRFEFSNTQPALATLSPTGAFTVQHAEFNLYGEKAVLNTE